MSPEEDQQENICSRRAGPQVAGTTESNRGGSRNTSSQHRVWLACRSGHVSYQQAASDRRIFPSAKSLSGSAWRHLWAPPEWTQWCRGHPYQRLWDAGTVSFIRPARTQPVTGKCRSPRKWGLLAVNLTRAFGSFAIDSATRFVSLWSSDATRTRIPSLDQTEACCASLNSTSTGPWSRLSIMRRVIGGTAVSPPSEWELPTATSCPWELNSAIRQKPVMKCRGQALSPLFER